MDYPPKITVIAPHFRMVDDAKLTGTHSARLVLLEAFATLTVLLDDRGRAHFRQQVEIDPTGDQSVHLLQKLTRPLNAETVLAGFRLDHVLASLVRVPRDSEHEAEAKNALLRMKLALSQPPIDGWWLASKPFLVLNAAAIQFGLPARWEEPVTVANTTTCRATLAARAQSMWAAIVADRMPAGDPRRRAFADFDRWRTTATQL